MSPPTYPIQSSAALTGSGQLSPSGQLELRPSTCFNYSLRDKQLVLLALISARCRPAYLVVYGLSYCQRLTDCCLCQPSNLNHGPELASVRPVDAIALLGGSIGMSGHPRRWVFERNYGLNDSNNII